EQLQEMLNLAHEYAQEWQFRFNSKPGKSDVVISPWREDAAAEHRFTLGEAVLHISKQYKYLGVEMGQAEANRWGSYLDRIRRTAMAPMFRVLHSVRGSRPMQLKTAVHLYKTLVRSVLEYADGIWGGMCNSAALTMLEQVQERFGR